MVKTIAQIYIDADVKERHKAAGTNISAVCNQFLKIYFEDDKTENTAKDASKEIEILKVKLVKARAQAEAQKVKDKQQDKKKEKERLARVVLKLRELLIKKQNGSSIAKEAYKTLFEATRREFNLERLELAKKVF